MERSSGFHGFRCRVCGTWIYENQLMQCNCDKNPLKFDVKKHYRLSGSVRLQEGLYSGTTIPNGTLLKLLYWDGAIVNVEAIEGPCDGLTFVTSPKALYESH